jgi:hypothetical protein
MGHKILLPACQSKDRKRLDGLTHTLATPLPHLACPSPLVSPVLCGPFCRRCGQGRTHTQSLALDLLTGPACPASTAPIRTRTLSLTHPTRKAAAPPSATSSLAPLKGTSILNPLPLLAAYLSSMAWGVSHVR